MIVMGAAWESLDFFYTLALLLQLDGHSSAATLVMYRVDELMKSGRGSMVTDAPNGKKLASLLFYPGELATDDYKLKRFYKKARKAALLWQAARHAYMEEQFSLGRHPDTEADFWIYFHAPAAPVVPGS